MRSAPGFIALSTALVLAMLAIGCSDVTTDLVGNAQGAITPQKPKDAGTKKPGDATPVDAGPRAPAMCGKNVCACDNGADDDGDALSDGFDPECTGPFDDDESTFATSKMPGPAAGPGCRGCFWNPKPGKAGDECRYASECLEGRTPMQEPMTEPMADPMADPMMMKKPAAKVAPAACTCEVSEGCAQSCLERTPNGCDCFGCCEVTRDDGSRVQVLLNERCSLQKLDDKAACPACVPSAQCHNDCGTCELCPGRTRDELPALCTSDACDEGQQACGPGSECPLDYYCQQGCCLYVLP